MRSPIQWFGGKHYMVKHLLPLLKVPHTHYCEPFGGGASILLAKPPSKTETYNDLDSSVVNFFRVLRDPASRKELIQLASLTPHSREQYTKCRLIYHSDPDPLLRAWAFFVVSRQSFSGRHGAGWGFGRKGSAAHTWVRSIPYLEQVAPRLLTVQIENQGWNKVVTNLDGADTLFYMDPPYHHSVRSGVTGFTCDSIDHSELLDKIGTLKAKVVITHFPHQDYFDCLSEWNSTIVKRPMCSVVRNRKSNIVGSGLCKESHYQIEVVWWNYDPASGEKVIT
jgi:DNA adenine methylase